MAAVGICGTDLHQVKGEFRRPTPMVLGHEGAGVVEEVGGAVTRVAPGRRGRALLGAVVRRVRRLPARAPGDVPRPQRGHPERDAARRDDRDVVPGRDGLPRHRDRVPRRARGRLRAGRAAAAGAGIPFDQAALLGCAVLTGVGAVLYAARVAPGVVGARDRRGRRRAVRRAGRADRRRRPTIVVCDPVDARLDAARRAGATHVAIPDGLRDVMRDALPDGADYGVRRGGRPRDDRDGAPLHARRRHRRDRRPAGAGAPARPRPVRADPEGEEAHRDAVRLGGPGRVAPGDAGARPRGQARARLVGRAVVPARRGERRGRGEPGRRGRARPRAARRLSGSRVAPPEARSTAPARPPPGARRASGRARAAARPGRRDRAGRSSPRSRRAASRATSRRLSRAPSQVRSSSSVSDSACAVRSSSCERRAASRRGAWRRRGARSPRSPRRRRRTPGGRAGRGSARRRRARRAAAPGSAARTSRSSAGSRTRYEPSRRRSMPRRTAQSCCIVAQSPCACSRETSSSAFSRVPDETAALPSWCTCSISRVAFVRE